MAQSNFPSRFVWGVATAAYQIEGAINEDGRGLSIWDTFSHTSGKTENGDTGDIACDHYHRWPEDVKLMQSLGVHAYRLSIAWSRVIPQGTGQVNTKGLDFYDRLVNALLEVNITPYVTLYHWDLPQTLQDHGGWANRDTVNAYVEYVQAVVARLGDRVKYWITHNEPWVASFVGNYLGRHAPGNQHLPTALQVAHHLLLSHGQAVPIIRSASSGSQVGITLNLAPGHAATQSEADTTATRYADGYRNCWFLDPLFGKGYPTDMVARFGAAMPEIQSGDLAQIAVQTDFLGVNFYYPVVVRADSSGTDPLGFVSLTPEEMRALGYSITEMGWPVASDAFRDLLIRLHEDYAPKAIYITENGAAFQDSVNNGQVHDPLRVDYLKKHLTAVQSAITAGSPVQGYFLWSLIDNFEWAFGYGKRFGIVYIDYNTQTRIPKDSAAWYRQVIAANTVVEDEKQTQAW